MRAALAGMLAMAAAMGIGRFVYTPILPLMLEKGTLDAAQAGLVAGANFLGYLIGALAASLPFFAAGRRRNWFMAGLSLSVLTTAAMALPLGLPEMALVRFASGIASAFAMIFVTSIVMAWLAQEERQGLIAFHFGGVGFGIAGSAALVSLLAVNAVDWMEIWLWAGTAALVALALSFLLLPANAPKAATAETDGVEPAFPSSLWTYIISYGFFGFGYVILATFINAMAKTEPALQPVEPYVWAVVGLAGFPSVWLWNLFAARYGMAAAYVGACLLEAVGVGLSVTVISPVMLLISAALLGATFMAITAIGLARTRLLTQGSPARAIALMTASFGLGQVVGPVVAGWLFEGTGTLFPASIMAAVALAIAAGLALVAERLHLAE